MVSVKVDDAETFPSNAVPTNTLPPPPVTMKVGGYIQPEPPTNVENPVMVQGLPPPVKVTVGKVL